MFFQPSHVLPSSNTYVREPAPPPPRPTPLITTTPTKDAYLVQVAPPPNHTLSDPEASPLDEQSMLIEGHLVQAAEKMHDYIVRSHQSPIYDAARRLLGYAPHGAIVRGSPPSGSGWIALDDGESFMKHDGSLVPRANHPSSSSSRAFAKRVDLPSDADLSRATLRSGGSMPCEARAGEAVTMRCVFAGGPRVAIRSATHVNASILGSVARGDTVHGVIDEVDSNWLRIKTGAYIMIRHPTHGVLLEPATPPAAPKADGRFVVHVPRHAPSPSPTNKRPAASVAAGGAPSYEKARSEASTSAAGSRPPQASTDSKTAPGGSMARAEMAAARREEKRSRTEKSAVEELSGHVSSVLAECVASTENVQRPQESEEAWVAVDGGGFAPMATA